MNEERNEELNENLRLLYETLNSKLNTRENSILAVTTITSSVCFVIYSIIQQNYFRPDFNLIFLGLWFSFLGILYREFTIFTTDRWDHEKLRKIEKQLNLKVLKEKKLNEKVMKENKASLCRAIIIRTIFYSSFTIFLSLLTKFQCSLFVFILIAFILSVILSFIEFVFWEDK